MNALAQSAPPAEPVAPVVTVPLLRTLVLCDLVDSTALVERMGDQRATDLFRKHDRLARALVHRHGGREIDKTDGFLMMFDRPIQAVAFALDYQRALKALNDNEKTSLASRVGIHVGDVLTWDNAPDDIAKGAKQVEVEGLVKPITSRLMQLALPNQILLSGVAHSLAHRSQGELGEQLATVRWRTHGRYRFKGIPDPIPVFEVGEEGHAPLKPPPWSGKAHREIPFWRRPATMGIEIGLLVLLLAIPGWYLLKPSPAIAFANRDWVVVGDLKNLTGESGFDEAIDTAFRIGLEQSRYVNVLSSLKTRDTVKLMQQDPDKTKIDRAVGSEIAIRDGARALILPTIAEIGGRVRVTAEVVDPNTQTTVWSESADGVGADSVLPSLDRVNQQLRVRLGEALATVSNESRPLDKVATKNLDALRAYSLGEHAFQSAHDKEAEALYAQALKLDADFALARIGMARVLVAADKSEQAREQLKQAALLDDRLSARDKLYVDAWQSSLAGSNKASIEKWKVLANLYPDLFAAKGLYAYFSWQFENLYSDEIIDAASQAASPRNPYASTSQLLLGMLYLGNERYADARQQFAAAARDGMPNHSDYLLPDAAQRNFAKVDLALGGQKPETRESGELFALVSRVAITADRGNWSGIRKVLDAPVHFASTDTGHRPWVTDAIAVALMPFTSTAATSPADLRDYVKFTKERLGRNLGAERAELQFALLFASRLAVGNGDTGLAQTAYGAAGVDPTDDGHPMVSKMASIAAADIARSEGRVDEAIGRLKGMLDGTELYLTHSSLMQAYATKKDYAKALDEANWLSSHRGRAYAEFSPQFILMPTNVVESNLALLSAAEYSVALGKKAEATRLLEQFRKSSPEAGRKPDLDERIRNLQTKL